MPKHMIDDVERQDAGAQTAALPLDEGPGLAASPRYHALLRDVQSRLQEQVRLRAKRALERFAQQLDELAARQEELPSQELEDPLRKTQEIRYPSTAAEDGAGLGMVGASRNDTEEFSPHVSSARSSGVLDCCGRLEDLQSQLLGLRKIIEAAQSRKSGQGGALEKDALERAVQSGLREPLARIHQSVAAVEDALREALEMGRLGSPGGDREAGGVNADLLAALEGIAASLERIESSASAQVPAPAGSDSLSQILERLEALEARLESRGVTTDSAPLMERFADLEATLAERWESIVERLVDTIENSTGDPGPVAWLDEIGQIREIVGKVASASHGDLDKHVKSLQREFSLLVHTINEHLEETRHRSEVTAETVRSTIEELQQEGQLRPSEESREEQLLVSCTQGIEELRSLPEKISSLLNAADEVHQYTITSAIQEATESILKKLETLAESPTS